jgi:hypothetical protein
MGKGRRYPAMGVAVLLGGCAIAGPIIDPSMDDAPVRACTRFDAASAEAGPQCLTVFRRGPNREALILMSGELRPGDVVYATRTTAPGCEGRFTHVVATGDTAGPGRLGLFAADAIGRGDVGREFAWDEARANRRWSVGRIDRVHHIPGAIRLQMREGEVRLTSLCLSSYHDD